MRYALQDYGATSFQFLLELQSFVPGQTELPQLSLQLVPMHVLASHPMLHKQETAAEVISAWSETAGLIPSLTLKLNT